ncbi:MAG: TrbC/VirB2 family protein [Eubacterium sp.]|nr:TrbC/VirB2 family protein [Eubacterium sp.]
MQGLVNGIYKITSDLQPVTLAVLILMLAIAGITTIIGGEESRGFIKDKFKYIILGSAIAFGAMAIGKEIAAWFM